MTRRDRTRPGSHRSRLAVRAGAVALVALSLAGCETWRREADVTASIPNDHRLRHPIAIREGDKQMEVFVGAKRGGLTPSQRAEVLSFAQSWRHEATGGVVIEIPAGTPNERAAADTLPEIQSTFAAVGLPRRAMVVQPYRPPSPDMLATIRIRYPKMVAEAGPCGTWPDDLGPNIANRGWIRNQPYWNFGCASQRNLAAMVENPADLVQPRGETPPDAMRRATVIDKYRAGTSPNGKYDSDDKGRLSDVGQ
ncbi:Flp pilus assembly protein CpaD [Rhodovulum sp. PH10]|uniref:CpaD family pilus assembly protein n=1 Tax=Rhodovulum sp. PH10 TaxID=1187851 RepID=UPI00027C1E68|nr:CpaD family pilus assembly protein [Rhodovulum sp. PH10]EJW10951.1 Flp pilus assembly protein CpaD [Rhodovulum sp. PH10]